MTIQELLATKIPDKMAKQLRIAKLKQLLRETDYQAIKFAEKMLTESEYEPMRVQRQNWRDEINLLEQA